MSRARLAIVLAGLFLAACGGGDSSWWDHALARMREQPRYDRFEASGVFADGKVLQEPPAGTVPRERVLAGSGIAMGMSGGKFLDTIPVAVDSAVLARGASRFGIICATCHGVGGWGGSLVAMNWPGRPPVSLHDPQIRALPPGQLFEVITNGFNRMPGYAATLDVNDRWAVVAYVQRLETEPVTTAAERTDSIRGAVRAGYDTLNFGSNH